MKKIIINNYRCFENLSLDFSDKINLIIGDNNSGKTTIIKAISAVLNTYFSGYSDDNTRFIGLSNNDFRVNTTNIYPIKIDFEWLNIKNSLQLNSTKSKPLIEPLKDIKNKTLKIYQNLFDGGKQVLPLPVFANFLNPDIHKRKKNEENIFKKYDHKPSFGYFECLNGNSFLNYWTLRLLVLKEGKKGDIEINGVINALLKVLGNEGCNIITQIEINPLKRKVFYIFNDGRLTDTESLSDGLRRLIDIVLNISFRCMLLNKSIYGLNACEKTEGTVLIDEIDLHLDTKLQSVIMKSLQKAFPNIQFIITSNSPVIISAMSDNKNNKIIQLKYNQYEGYTAKEYKNYNVT